LEVTPSLSLSTPEELRLRLHWVALLYGRVKADLAVTGGVHSHADVLKALMAGASITMMTSALLMRGIDCLTGVLAGLREWLAERDYHAVRMLQGCMSFRSVSDPGAFERANYVKTLRSHVSG
jgi:dihydroorotate dehydrogenase (fumarate)